MTAVDPVMAHMLLQRARDARPAVHCLTNHVARAFTANVLLAVGAIPSMSADESEVGAFVSGADALLINLGTLEPSMRGAINMAMDVAAANTLPVVVDPVFANRSDARAAYARNLIGRRPAAVRCNREEAAALGEDTLVQAFDAGTIVALTGVVDHVQGSGRQADIEGGHPLMTRVTAMGCALGAVQAAFLAVADDRFDAVCAACLVFKRAGQIAGAAAAGPGSFVPAFLDVLHGANEALLRTDTADR